MALCPAFLARGQIHFSHSYWFQDLAEEESINEKMLNRILGSQLFRDAGDETGLLKISHQKHDPTKYSSSSFM